MHDRPRRGAGRCGEQEDVNACAAGSCFGPIRATVDGRSIARRTVAAGRARTPANVTGSQSPRTRITFGGRCTWREYVRGEHCTQGTGSAVAGEAAVRSHDRALALHPATMLQSCQYGIHEEGAAIMDSDLSMLYARVSTPALSTRPDFPLPAGRGGQVCKYKSTTR